MHIIPISGIVMYLLNTIIREYTKDITLTIETSNLNTPIKLRYYSIQDMSSSLKNS